MVFELVVSDQWGLARVRNEEAISHLRNKGFSGNTETLSKAKTGGRAEEVIRAEPGEGNWESKGT